MTDKTEAVAQHSTADDILDGALCNYLNQVSDPFEPKAKWEELCERGLKRLGEAYEAWHGARRSAHAQEYGGWQGGDTPEEKASRASAQVATDFVLMPREATRDMTMAGCDSLPSCEHVFGHAGEMLRNAYRKMVAVAGRSPADTGIIERCRDMLDDVPGNGLEEKLTKLIGDYLALQIMLSESRAQVERSAWCDDIEMAPKDGAQILARWKTDFYDVISWLSGEWVDDEDRRCGPPTHWKHIDSPIPSTVLEKPTCKLCGLEDGACICRSIPSTVRGETNNG
jgi:hypothetical protein